MEARPHTWTAKVLSLVLGATVWWIIKGELQEKRSTVEDITLPPTSVREL